MGYTGNVRLNDHTIMSEYKNNGRFCIHYAQAYNMRKSAPLTLEAIKETTKSLHDGVASYSSIMYKIGCAGNIIRALGELVKGNCMVNTIDEDGNFLLVSRFQNNDAYGNGADINFYEKNDDPNIPETTLYGRMSLSDEQIATMRKKRYTHINQTNVFTMFNGVNDVYPNAREHYLKFIDDVYGIRTLNDVLSLLKIANNCYRLISKKYEECFREAMELTSVLEECRTELKNGNAINVRYWNKVAHFFGENYERDVTMNESFNVINLFKSIGTDDCGSGIRIDNLEDFRFLLNTFQLMNKEERSKDFEDMLRKIYNDVEKEQESFVLMISGGY